MLFKKTMYKKIYQKIKKYDTIVIARHVGADPDALASSIGLRDTILATFPEKKVYAVGFPASKFKFLGTLDKFQEEYYENSLLIVTDTPDLKRVDGVEPSKFKDSIKIDHHPFIENYCKLEWIDETASSASQMITELIFNTKLKLTNSVAEKLYTGIVSDTNRFLFYYTTPKTFNLVSKLMKKTNLDFTKLYESLYTRPITDLRFEGYIANNLKITENGFAYLLVTNELLTEYNIDASTARNMVSAFNYIEEILAWSIFTVDKTGDLIRGSIRSRGPIINEVASHYRGGGHLFASGARLLNEEELNSFVNEMDLVCKVYKEGK